MLIILYQVGCLIGEINEALATRPETTELELCSALSGSSGALFESLPQGIKNQLLLDRDPHGNVQVCSRAAACSCAAGC